ncbi:hypothetical protein F5B22DRAFT_426031 [Xylaria bambusicola]|uniref:uncharacterized protein n=1 Tax=Xylaria bambusicola TaxID=326684 RepID=UPI002007A7E2|nr:uncharacterized protein F5B22DRAFT_426031 [Xylaria bambusicola]KAI0508315.1 hypothetical protein F5B22DRAFT_426031 [Xylaria bambusicola]
MAAYSIPSQDGAEEIPRLTTIAPSIFVPTDRDFTKTPPPLSDDPTARLDAGLDTLDWHATRVENNMILMLQREAERVRRVAENSTSQQTVKEPLNRTGNDLLLEERLLEQDSEDVLKILREASQDAASGREGSRPQLPPRPRGPHDPEYTDLATLRSAMFRTAVDERQTPRSEALTHVLNLVKWGWDDQLEGHRGVVQKEKDERRAKLERQLKEGNFPKAANESATYMQTPSAPEAPMGMRNNSLGSDKMDIDEQ